MSGGSLDFTPAGDGAVDMWVRHPDGSPAVKLTLVYLGALTAAAAALTAAGVTRASFEDNRLTVLDLTVLEGP
jgi:hypothetical protein